MFSRSFWIALGAGVAGFVVMRVLRKTNRKWLDVGAVSEQWIVEHRVDTGGHPF
jgi:hypothetical protein